MPLNRLPRTQFPVQEQFEYRNSVSDSVQKERNRTYSLYDIDCNNIYKPARPRSQTWSGPYKYQKPTVSDRRVFAVIANIAHIIIGIAVTQLGIVGTWYQHYMNFDDTQLRYVIYVCVLFIVTGVYGVCITTKKLEKIKSHRLAYMVLSSLSIAASAFVIAIAIRLLISDQYQTDERVVVIFDGLILGLSFIEIPITLFSLYHTVADKSSNHQNLDCIVEEKRQSPSSWCSIFSMILNVAHVVLGLCIIEMGMVGMMYRRFMNVDTTGLFAIVFISVSFISVGVIGVYNQMSGKAAISCNRSMYTLASLLAAACATLIMSFVSVAMSSETYYTGIEAIVAFDVMILGMSSIELVVAVAATVLCLAPICMSKLNKSQI